MFNESQQEAGPTAAKVHYLTRAFDGDADVRRALVGAYLESMSWKIDRGNLALLCARLNFWNIFTVQKTRETTMMLMLHYNDALPRVVSGGATVSSDPDSAWIAGKMCEEWHCCPGAELRVREIVSHLQRASFHLNVGLVAAWLHHMPIWILGTLPWFRNSDTATIYKDLDRIMHAGHDEGRRIMSEEFDPCVIAATRFAGRRMFLRQLLHPSSEPVTNGVVSRMQTAQYTGGIVNLPLPELPYGYHLSRKKTILVPDR